MPTGMQIKVKYKDVDPEHGIIIYTSATIDAEMSCALKTNFADPANADQPNVAKLAEQANNNLHIWEIGEVLKQVGMLKGSKGLDFAVMAPQMIASMYAQHSYGAKPNLGTSNVIAALNGPMAHIYLKNRADNSWDSPRLVEDVGYFAEMLRLTLSNDKSLSNLGDLFEQELFEEEIPIYAGLERLIHAIDFILIRRGDNYEIFHGINSDGSDVISGPLSNYAELGSSLYVDALNRIPNMNHPDRSGDIVLIMRDYSSGNAIDRYSTAYACKSWHGSLNPSDSYVPLILAYPGGNKSEVEKELQKVSVCPAGQCAGNWNITNIIRNLIGSQYSNQ
jgi:hypothetical protein